MLHGTLSRTEKKPGSGRLAPKADDKQVVGTSDQGQAKREDIRRKLLTRHEKKKTRTRPEVVSACFDIEVSQGGRVKGRMDDATRVEAEKKSEAK